jgi:hypothetical protein
VNDVPGERGGWLTQVHERHDLPAHVQHTNDMNDTQFSHKRSKLLMPSPQVCPKLSRETQSTPNPASH